MFTVKRLEFRTVVNAGAVYGSLEVIGVADSCRTEDTYSVSPSAGKIWLHGLYKSKQAWITPEDFVTMLIKAPVTTGYVTDREATPEEVQKQREFWLGFVTTAKRLAAEAHPDYQPKFDRVVYA
jgi:hypothetical protein